MILLTGGAGCIGLHTAAVLVAAGREVVLFDNFSNSKPLGARRLETIVGRPVPCVEGDVRSRRDLDDLFDQYPIAAVIHFAGLKAVGESMAQPLCYYENNVAGTLVLLEAMMRAEVRRIVFSSSATVYGEPDSSPIAESAALRPANTYGRCKRMAEDILRDQHRAAPGWSIALLHYFNPVGAHPGGLIGKDPNGIPSNLMPFIAQVAVGRLPEPQVFGGAYPTPDGSGVRDYIHVMDLAQGHRAALEWALRDPREVLRRTWAPAGAIACWSWCGPSSRSAAGRFPVALSRAGRAILPRTGRSLARRRATGLDRATDAARHVPRLVELAAQQSAGLWLKL